MKTSWDTSLVLKKTQKFDLDALMAEIKEKITRFSQKWNDRSDFLEDPRVLKDALLEYEDLLANSGTFGEAGYYIWLNLELDQSNADLKAQMNKINDLSAKLENEINFFIHRISVIPAENQEKFLKDPELKDFKHFLEYNFNNAKYLLSEDEEKIINLMSSPAAGNWVRMTQEFLSKEEAEVLTEEGSNEYKNFAILLNLLRSKNKPVRESAFAAVNSIIEKHLDVGEHELNTVLQVKKISDELRKMSRPDISRHIADDIDTQVVDSLVKSVSENYSISRDFYELKAKLMGVDKLTYYERLVPYGKLERNYELEEALSKVHEVFTFLDPEFSAILETFLQNGQLDIFPKKGKSDGAYCVTMLKSLPTFVLLNFTGSFYDVTTIAHEMGHAINSEFMKQKENSLNFGNSTSMAEVSSIFMEYAVMDRLSQDLPDEEKLALNMFILDEAVGSVFRQIACYRFELDLHEHFREKGYLSKEAIGKLFLKYMNEYMGDFVEQTKGSENWWLYWDHIRRFFYVYSYASGFLISLFLKNRVSRDKNFINKYKEFLRTGTSKTPFETFKTLGIDVSDENFWQEGLDEIKKVLKETKDLAIKLGKI